MLELNRIYQGDCLDLMREMPDKSVDLVLTDPPYGVNYGGGASVGSIGKANACQVKEYILFDDSSAPSQELFNEIFRISKNPILFGGQHFTDKIPKSPGWIIWDKEVTGGKGDGFCGMELAWTSYKTGLKKFRFKWNGMLQEDMTHKDERVHPCQKPLKLMEWCLEKYSKPGMTVLDPFMGSGTTCVACKKLGRNYIGIEKEPEYIKIAEKRLEKVNNHKITDFFGACEA